MEATEDQAVPDIGIGPPPPPPSPLINISPAATSVALKSGQTVILNFLVKTEYVYGPVSLRVGSTPAGVTIDLPESLPAGVGGFTMTLTAASNVTPVAADITVTTTAMGERPFLKATATAVIALNAVAVGQVFPKYMILALLYAPPGTKAGNGTSQVTYGTGSTTGTTVSISSSFKEGVSATANTGVNLGIVNLGASGQFTASQTGTETSQVQISKNTNFSVTVKGPAEDGISHGSDQFLILLNPALNVTIDHQGNITWQPAINGSEELFQTVYVEWLQNPSLMQTQNPGTAQALAEAGLTTDDYAQIVACDPFASGSTTIDPNRFVPTVFSFPYEPPLAAGDPVDTWTYTQTSATTTSNSEQTQVQYGVTASVSAAIQVPFTASLNTGGSLEWTDTSTSTQQIGSSQSASVSVGGPEPGYDGPTIVIAYLDTVFGSWMFAFATGAPSASGTVTEAGVPVAGQPVALTVGGITLRSFTNRQGGYNFYGAAAGQGTITVRDQTFSVGVGPGEATATLQLSDATPAPTPD